jgi:hypothetical protein
MWLVLVVIQLFWLIFQLAYIYSDHYLDTLCSVDLARHFELPQQYYAPRVAWPIMAVGLWRDLKPFDRTAAHWWQNWTDDTLLVRMPIFGTHQSATYTINNVISLFAKSQKHAVIEQLNRGVRALDVRLKLNKRDGKLYAFHDFVDLNMSWAKLWNGIESWLRSFPREGLLLFIRDEDYKDHYGVTEKALLEVDSAIRAKRFVLNNDEFDLTDNLRVGDLRGKVFLVNHASSRSLPWADNRNFVIGRVNVSDRYEMADRQEKLGICCDFYKDIPVIGGKALVTLAAAANGMPDAARVGYLNVLYTSLANKSPLSSIQRIADQLNSEFFKWLDNNEQPVKGCVIMMDWFQ